MAQGRKTGGRQKGTPNKPNPLKEHLRAQSTAYFEPKPQTNADGSPRKIEFRDKDGLVYNEVVLADADGKPLVISDFEVDMMMMDPKEPGHDSGKAAALSHAPDAVRLRRSLTRRRSHHNHRRPTQKPRHGHLRLTRTTI